MREQLLTEQEGRRAEKLEAGERVKYAQTENGYLLQLATAEAIDRRLIHCYSFSNCCIFALVEALEQRCKQVGEAFRVKDEAISVAEQIRDTSKNYLKQKDEEIESLRLEVVSNR